MCHPLTSVPTYRPTFLGLPRCDDLASLDADIAILGVPWGVPASMATSRAPSSEAPAAIREASLRYARYLDHPDIDSGGPILGTPPIRVVDCGDVAMFPRDLVGNSARTTEVIRTILAAGVVPIVLGGDHSIPIPVMRGFDHLDRMAFVQFDAHLDYRDEVNGEHEGLSSGTRRASELPFVGDIIQIGLRGIGSARQDDIDDARARGNRLILAQDIHVDGTRDAIGHVPDADAFYITFDMDVMDPSIAPGINSPAFGGLTYWQAVDLLEGVAARGTIVGFDINEIAPRHDVNNLTSLLAARLILSLIAAMRGNQRAAGRRR